MILVTDLNDQLNIFIVLCEKMILYMLEYILYCEK